MKTCKDCKYAEWKKTTAGRLHPSGDGKCLFPYKIPPAPNAFYFIGGTPNFYGGMIEEAENIKRIVLIGNQ